MKELAFIEKLTDKVWVSLLIWIVLLLLKTYVFTNAIFGVIAEVGGFFIFATALYKWSKRINKKK